MIILNKKVKMCLWVLALSIVPLSGCGEDEDESEGDSDSETGSETDDEEWDPAFDSFVVALKEDLAASNAYGVSVAVMQEGEMTQIQAFEIFFSSVRESHGLSGEGASDEESELPS